MAENKDKSGNNSADKGGNTSIKHGTPDKKKQDYSQENFKNSQSDERVKNGGDTISKLEQKEEKVEDETLKNTRDVRKVKDELKREKVFNSFNGWLSIITFGLLILAIFSVYIYGTSVNARNKIKFADLRADVEQSQERIQNLGENVKISALGLQNATNQIHELDEKINNIEKGQIENQSKIDIAIANLKSSSSEPKVEPLDLEKYALTEAHYLIKMSFRKMYLEKDISTAIALLKDANDVLARVDEPNFLRIQKSINNDIIRLSKLEISDSEEIILRLCAMDENIKSLPVLGYKVNFNESADSEETPNQVSENIEDWKENVWSNTVNFLGKLVVVKKKDENGMFIPF